MEFNKVTIDGMEFNGIVGFATIDKDTSQHEPAISRMHLLEFNGTFEVKDMAKGLLNMMYGRKVFQGSMNDISLMFFNFFHSQWIRLGYSTIYDIKIKQNKTHKKYRVNKKWAKRYGYTCTVLY